MFGHRPKPNELDSGIFLNAIKSFYNMNINSVSLKTNHVSGENMNNVGVKKKKRQRTPTSRHSQSGAEACRGTEMLPLEKQKIQI